LSINERSRAVNRANPKLIGAFVVGAVALVVIGVLLLGGAQWLTQKRPVVAYFEGSVKGLNVGAPVEFQGVRIGAVTDIQLQFLTAEMEFRIPVFIQIEPDKMTQVGRQVEVKGQLLKPLIERGLRAQLEMQSIVTGQLMVQLGFYPDTPVKLVGDGKVPEIPTLPTTMQQVAQNVTQALAEIRQLPIPQLIGQLVHSVEGVNALVHSPEVTQLLRSVNATAQVAERSLTRLDAEIAPEVRGQLKQALEAATALLRDSQQLVRRVDAQVVPLSTGLQKTLDATRATLQDSQQLVRRVDARVTPMTDNLMETSTRLRATMARLQQVVDGDVVRVLQDANRTLQEFSGAARSARLLTDYLERNPDSLVYGKGGSRS
jgi:phospholipid/cholesterol/gamma-HCH transport system substrate-binding protein